jgi:HlyD family secretion protein
MKKNMMIFVLTALLLFSCNDNSNQADAYGSFEADEINLSSEISGKIVEVLFSEGQEVKEGQILMIIDTTQLHLKKLQLEAQIKSILSKTKDAEPQLNVLYEQKKTLDRERIRFEKLMLDSAATKKQVDDIISQIQILEKNILALASNLSQTNSGIISEIEPLRIQILQIEDNIKRSYISSPISGTILGQYAEIGELSIPGKIIFKIANIDELFLRAYIAGTQLSDIKLGQKIRVRIDKGKNDFYSYNGEITYISDKAEFTPKIIQTKDERVNLVYAIKVKVKNDGRIKIGMPGEIVINNLGN